MDDMRLVKTALREGVWRGELRCAGGERPRVTVIHQGQPLEGVEIAETGDGIFTLKAPIPAGLLSDGVHSFVITDTDSDTRLGHFTIIAGQPADDDLRAEIELLRAELDMLKKAFRRHCLETT